MRSLAVFLLTASLMGPAAARAQHQVTAGLVITDPRGELDLNTDGGAGLGATYLYSLDPRRVVAIGLTGSLQTYGSTKRRTALSGTIPDITVDVQTNNSTVFLQGVLQLKAPLGRIEPYVQGTGGFGWFYTTTALLDPESDLPLGLGETNQDDGGWVYGGGGGLMIQVWQSRPREPTLSAIPPLDSGQSDRNRVLIDLGVRYLAGDEVEYLREGSLVTDDGEFDIDARLARSDVEALQYQIAATFEF